MGLQMHIGQIIINLYIVLLNYQAVYQNFQDNVLHFLLHKVKPPITSRIRVAAQSQRRKTQQIFL